MVHFYFFSFAEDSILFQCRYSRTVSVDDGMTVELLSSDPVVGTGDINYSLSLTVGSLGGDTQVSITRNHHLDQITPRLATRIIFLNI